MPVPATKSRLTFLAAAALLFLFWWQAVSASRHWSQTSDELPHLTAGYAYDRFGDFRFHPENGNLPQRVHGLAPLALGARLPLDDGELWRHSNYWQLGWDFFYTQGNPTDKMLLGGRALNALFGVALGSFIFAVARRWYGDAGGLLALGLYCLCPNFLAHSALATSDLAGTLMLTVAPWLFWRHLERRSAGSGALAGLGSGLALVAKFNGILLAPIYLLLAGADCFRAPPGRRGRRLAENLALCCLQAVGAVIVVWIFYGFRFRPDAAGLPAFADYNWPWRPLEQTPGWFALSRLRQWQLLPDAYLMGLAHVLAGAVERPSFLAGEHMLRGSWQFFPVLFLLKTGTAILLALPVILGVGAVRWLRARADGRSEILLRWAPVLTPAFMVAAAALSSNLNIGHRHILGVYPALFIAAGGLVTTGGRWRALIPLALLLTQAVESIRIRPHYLAYFNPLGGGPSRAYRLAVDSSLDWGQALPALREWLAAHRRPGEKLHLAYFGNAWPPHYGVRPDVFLFDSSNLARPPHTAHALEPGLYAISATSLCGVYSGLRGPWRPEWEADYRTAPRDGELFARLRVARLFRYLQSRAPDAQAGHAILIYRLAAEDLAAALEGPAPVS